MLILRHVSIDGEIDVLLVYLGHFSFDHLHASIASWLCPIDEQHFSLNVSGLFIQFKNSKIASHQRCMSVVRSCCSSDEPTMRK